MFDLTDPECPAALGDTHLLPRQAARMAGVSDATIRCHAKKGRFQEARAWLSPDVCTEVCYEKYYVVIEYDAALHDYIQERGLRQQWSDADKAKAARLAQDLPIKRIADRTGIPTPTLQTWSQDGIIDPPPAHRQKRSKAEALSKTQADAYRRQCYAQQLQAQGKEVPEIADMMHTSRRTIKKYLNGAYEPA